MLKSLLDDIVERLRRLDFGFKGAVAASTAAFFSYHGFLSLGCLKGALACGSLSEFGVVFPFYVILTSFIGRINFFTYALLYLISSAVYVIIAYQAARWLEQMYQRLKNRPRVVIKRIYQ